jgi:hypothetical protein
MFCWQRDPAPPPSECRAKTRGLTNVSQGAHHLSPIAMSSHRRADASVSPRIFAPSSEASLRLFAPLRKPSLLLHRNSHPKEAIFRVC